LIEAAQGQSVCTIVALAGKPDGSVTSRVSQACRQSHGETVPPHPAAAMSEPTVATVNSQPRSVQPCAMRVMVRRRLWETTMKLLGLAPSNGRRQRAHGQGHA